MLERLVSFQPTEDYLLLHENIDATTWRPGEDHQREVRWAERHGGKQRLPEDRGFPDEWFNGHHVMLDTEELVTVRWDQVEEMRSSNNEIDPGPIK